MWSHLDALLARVGRSVPARHRKVAGAAAFLALAWLAVYGHLWSFERLDQHRMTARALLSGTFRLRSAVTQVENDEQVHDGAVYTNWGYGVPILQAPFHALARAIGLFHGFFPDRAIYFFFAALTMPVLWSAIDRLLAARPEGHGDDGSDRDGRRAALSWTLTWVVLTSTLFPLTSTRFVLYEETVAYFLLFQFLATSAYIAMIAPRRGSSGVLSAFALGGAAGMGLLIRPTGAVYVGVWTALVALGWRPRRILAFLVALIPLVTVWLATNRVRTGSVFGLGYPNTIPAWLYNIPIERFGSECSNTPGHALLGLGRLFTGFFLFVTRRASDPWLSQCHFDFEERAGVIPFFGPIVLGGVCAMLSRLVSARERRVVFYVPYAVIAFLFLSFVRRGQGFAWRYTGDFWPAILVAAVQYLHTRPHALVRSRDPRLVKGLLGYGLCVYACFLVPWFWSPWPETVSTDRSAEMAARFESARFGHDESFPARLSCGEPLAPIFRNGAGWSSDCGVDTFTNVFIGVPPRSDDRYRVRARTEGIEVPGARMYVNGAIYDARRVGDVYEAYVSIPSEKLVSRIVVVTVQWTRSPPAPPGKLLSIEVD